MNEKLDEIILFILQLKLIIYSRIYELPWWLSDKEFPCNEGDVGLIPGWRRSPGEGNGKPPQYSWTEEPGRLQSVGSQRVRHD